MAKLSTQRRRVADGLEVSHATKIGIGKTNTAILIGAEDLTLWDDEELRRGYKKDKNGRWSGRPPKIVPKAIHDELVKRTLTKANELMRDNLVAAVEVLAQIAKDPAADESARLKAVDMIMNRVMGKAPEKVAVTVEEKPAWLDALEGGIVSMPAVIDADSTEATNGDT